MIARFRKQIEEKDKGFTLVELLVVIIIIGILAAVAIPAFLRQRENAWASAVTSDLKNASIAAESFATQHNGKYTGLTPAELKANGYNQTSGVKAITVTLTGTGDTGYTLTTGHDNLGSRSWTYDSATGVIKEAAATP